MSSHQDLAISALADELAAMSVRTREAEIDRDIYRALAQESISAVRFVTLQRNSLRRQLAALREEFGLLFDRPAFTDQRSNSSSDEEERPS